MIPVYQTVFGPHGDCFAACVASILELTIGEVPDLRGLEDWSARFREWLLAKGWQVEFSPGPPKDWSIAAFRVLTGHIHSVVCLDGEIVHDPSRRPLAHQSNPVLLWTALTPSSRA